MLNCERPQHHGLSPIMTMRIERFAMTLLRRARNKSRLVVAGGKRVEVRVCVLKYVALSWRETIVA